MVGGVRDLQFALCLLAPTTCQSAARRNVGVQLRPAHPTETLSNSFPQPRRAYSRCERSEPRLALTRTAQQGRPTAESMSSTAYSRDT